MTKYHLIAKPKGGHHFYAVEGGKFAGKVAVADDSMQVMGNPETSDDGLLLLDKDAGVTLTLDGDRMYFGFRVHDAKGVEFGCGGSLAEGQALLGMGMRLIPAGYAEREFLRSMTYLLGKVQVGVLEVTYV